jgi:glycine/D-amino acid oxidase-like deaminating enzyme
MDGSLGWRETTTFARPMPTKQVTGDGHYDYIIVGAGFSGLAVAGHLAKLEPDARIALIDALEVGQGTSGRNAGFIIDLPHNLDSDKPDPVFDQKIRDLNCFAIERLDGIQQQQKLDVQWLQAGKYLAAHEEKHFGNLDAFITTLDALNTDYDVFEGEALAARLGTHYYRKAVYTPGNIVMNPAALALCVASALPANVELFEKSPIRAVDLRQRKLQMERGSFSADCLILATNAFTEEFGGCSNRLAPIFTYASLTRQLSAQELRSFQNIEPWGLTSAHPAGTTVRLTPDNRIFVRNSFDVLPTLSSHQDLIERAKVRHRKSLAARFSNLSAVPFEYSWGGMLCMTMNHESVFNERYPNVFVLAGMNGVGVAKGTYLGYYMAEYVTRKTSPTLDFIINSAHPSWVPPDPLKTMGARIRLSFEQRIAKGEV